MSSAISLASTRSPSVGIEIPDIAEGDLNSHPASGFQSLSSLHGLGAGGKKMNVGILGATGMVGQRFIVLLSKHGWFKIHALGASSRSATLPYSKAMISRWKQTVPIPSNVRDMTILGCQPNWDATEGEEAEEARRWKECEVVFSGLDADVAGEIESSFRSADIPIFSNAKNFRRDPHVPLIVPLVNSYHFAIIPQQQHLHSPPLKKGFIVTNANCSTTAIVVPLHALERAFGPLEKVMCTTMQAISGAGYPGVSGMDIVDNVVPFIGGEEEKMEWETLKILGGITEVETDDQVGEDGKAKTLKTFDMHANHPLRISASCNRVPVIDGHMACVSCSFARRPPPSPQQVREALASYALPPPASSCPSAPVHPIVVHEEQDRPQPRLDRYHQDGAGVSVGRVRQCQVLDIKFVVLGNNVSVGAATSSVMNAELAVLRGFVGGVGNGSASSRD